MTKRRAKMDAFVALSPELAELANRAPELADRMAELAPKLAHQLGRELAELAPDIAAELHRQADELAPDDGAIVTRYDKRRVQGLNLRPGESVTWSDGRVCLVRLPPTD